MKSILSKVNGITLIALVITIVIIIILAGITINLTVGENGIFKKAKVAREDYLNAQISEQRGINDLYAQLFVANDGTVTIDATKLQELIQSEVKKATAGSTSNPAGTVIAYMNDDTPTGYLACNGQAVSRTEYAELFTAIGTKYGAGDGSTTFNVPNLTGKFLKGNTTAGASEEAGLPNIIGNFDVYAYNAGWGTGPFKGSLKSAKQLTGGTSNNFNYVDYEFNATNSSAIYGKSTTVTPENMSVLYCIKY